MSESKPIANWNAARQDRIQAARFLNRVEAEFVQQMARTDRGIADHQQSPEANRRLIDAVAMLPASKSKTVPAVDCAAGEL